MNQDGVKKVVLAYSGGLDTSVILKWLQEEYKADVITFCADLGQDEELTGLHAKARKCGAVKSYIEDLQDEFVQDFVFPMLQANAIYENSYLLGTSIARPLIAKRLVEIAVKADNAESAVQIRQFLEGVRAVCDEHGILHLIYRYIEIHNM